MTYWASEEDWVYQIDLLSVARPIGVVVGWAEAERLATVQAVEVAGVVNRGAGVGVLRNNGWAMPERWEVWEPEDPWASRRPEAPWRSGPAWLPRDR